MKVCVVLAFVAACVAATHSNPVPISDKNWQNVYAKIGEIESVIFTGIQQIKQISRNDNRQIGRSISSKLDVAAIRVATTILAPAAAQVQNQSLTEAKAQVLVEQLKEFIIQVENSLEEKFVQLSETASNQIRIMLKYAYTTAEQKAQALYDLLTCMFINWQAVSAKIMEFATLVRNTTLEIEYIAVNDNGTVGNDLARKLHAASVNTTAFLNETAAAIKDSNSKHSLVNLAKIKTFNFFAKPLDDLKEELNQLSGTAQEKIKVLLELSSRSTENIGELIDVLRVYDRKEIATYCIA